MEQADYKSPFSPMHTPVLINLQSATAKPLFPEWLVCHAENFPKIIANEPAERRREAGEPCESTVQAE